MWGNYKPYGSSGRTSSSGYLALIHDIGKFEVYRQTKVILRMRATNKRSFHPDH